jgi:hypothetical protein
MAGDTLTLSNYTVVRVPQIDYLVSPCT